MEVLTGGCFEGPNGLFCPRFFFNLVFLLFVPPFMVQFCPENQFSRINFQFLFSHIGDDLMVYFCPQNLKKQHFSYVSHFFLYHLHAAKRADTILEFIIFTNLFSLSMVKQCMNIKKTKLFGRSVVKQCMLHGRLTVKQ